MTLGKSSVLTINGKIARLLSVINASTTPIPIATSTSTETAVEPELVNQMSTISTATSTTGNLRSHVVDRNDQRCNHLESPTQDRAQTALSPAARSRRDLSDVVHLLEQRSDANIDPDCCEGSRAQIPANRLLPENTQRRGHRPDATATTRPDLC